MHEQTKTAYQKNDENRAHATWPRPQSATVLLIGFRRNQPTKGRLSLRSERNSPRTCANRLAVTPSSSLLRLSRRWRRRVTFPYTYLPIHRHAMRSKSQKAGSRSSGFTTAKNINLWPGISLLGAVISTGNGCNAALPRVIKGLDLTNLIARIIEGTSLSLCQC